ncbi:hypothetical protein BDW42DRAFT_108002 [Aspergillus taichungensis]|uniref:Uncharacterized protein n=1 Tax=Aspergillus taichungensis TaxID=482145 RepID=A0A2J5I7V1_9EURO|nr:hypothetical protein BDW42DRAFT_108002 [Aspergillus taichungensis]
MRRISLFLPTFIPSQVLLGESGVPRVAPFLFSLAANPCRAASPLFTSLACFHLFLFSSQFKLFCKSHNHNNHEAFHRVGQYGRVGRIDGVC